MLRVVTVSSSAERHNAERLAGLIRKAWPGIDGSTDDEITIAAGIRLTREIDLLVTIELQTPRRCSEGDVLAGILVIEAKALDLSRFELAGNDLRPIYRDGPAHYTLLEQLDAQILGVKQILQRFGPPCYVHGLAWLLGATTADLDEATPDRSAMILGSDASWDAMVSAAAAQNACIVAPASQAQRHSVHALCNRLTSARQLSARDHTRLNHLTTEVLCREAVDDVVVHAGRCQVRLQGRAGTGKSTTLALVARRIFERDEGRLLFLTYHRALRAELDHLVTKLARVAGMAPECVVVTTMFDFLERAMRDLGGTLAYTAEGNVDYTRLPEAMASFIAGRGLAALRSDALVLREMDPAHFNFEYVFVDEAQDWRPSERDLLRAFFPPERTILADGVDQFAQRESRCDWSSDVRREQRYVRELKRSLRMSNDIAMFATAFARAMRFEDWHVATHSELSGGRIVLVDGAIEGRPELVERLLQLARDAQVSPGDCLVAVPPSHVVTVDGARRAKLTPILNARGIETWEAVDSTLREVPRQPDALPIVPYASIRGLEGWATLLVGLDAWYDNRYRHPNTEAGEATPDVVAKRALLLAITRAAHVLAITIDDASSPVAQWLNEATSEMTADCVEHW